MAEFRHDPETLSDALDALLADPDFGGDDVLLQTAARLLNAPPLAMSSEASARIETQVLDTFKNLPPPRSPFTPLPFIGGIIAVLIIAGAIFVAMQSSTPAAAPAPTNTLVFTPTLVDTATSSPVTSAPVVIPQLENDVDEPNFTRTPIASAVPTNTPRATTVPTAGFTFITNTPDVLRLPATNTPVPSPSAAPSLTATTQTLISVIVEGVVDTIGGTLITIDNNLISVNPDEPLLGVI